MAFRLSSRSLASLEGVNPSLVKVVNLAILKTPIDFVVIEGLRTRERQKVLVQSGASKTMNSRHITGHAVDLAAWVGGAVRWDWPLYPKLAWAMKEAAAELGIPIVWGGDWVSFRDGPHFELKKR